MVPIVDAHLDMAWNAVQGRELESLTATELRAREQRSAQQAMVSLPELRRGAIAIVFGSIFVRPKHTRQDVDPVFDEETRDAGLAQADVYRRWEDLGLVRIIRSRRALADHLAAWAVDRVPGLVVAIEGAEPIRDPDDLQVWFDLGVRSIGPAWGHSRYSGGFSGPWGRAYGFTPQGRELLAGMRELGVLLDLAHSSVESWTEGIEIGRGMVACTHTTPREVVLVDRMPDAGLLRALAAAGGVVGLGLGGIFLDRAWWSDDGERPPLRITRVGEVISLMAEATGWEHVGIGSDLDGGIGLEESPLELESIADLGRLAEVLPDDAAAGALGGNWIRLLERVLPQ